MDDSELEGFTTFTVTFWVKYLSSGHTEYIVNKWYDGSNAVWAFYTGGTVSFSARDSGNSNYLTTSLSSLTGGEWHHISGVYNGSEIQIYFDGVKEGNLSMTGTVNSNTAPFTIGCQVRTAAGLCNNGDGQYFNGSIDEVMIFNRSLTASEISDLYNNQSNGSRTLESDASLVSYWHMEDNLGYNFEDSKGGNNGTLNINDSATIDDFSSQSNDGTINGNAYVSGGRYGTGMSFDGDGDYVDVGDANVLDLTSNGTISAWVKPDSITQAAGIVNKRNGDTFATIGYGLLQSTDNKFTLNIANGVDISDSLTSDGVMTNGAWSHLVATWNSGNWTLYLDGSLDKSQSGLTSAIADNNGLKIGSRTASAGTYFNGSIDEVQIYNRSLSANEIYQLYVSNLYKYDTDKWGLYVNQSKNATDGLDVGDYTYYVWGNDIHGNNNKSETRSVTIESGAVADNPPTVTLSLPPDNNVSEQGIVTFEINSTDDNELSNLTLYIWNSSEGIIITNFTTINGTSNSTNLTYNFQFNNLTTWNGYVCDNASQCSWATSNFTLNITTPDETYPTWENNKTNLTAGTTQGNSVYFNITLNESNPGVYVFSWFNGSDWANDSSVSYSDGEEIEVAKTVSADIGNINWTWYVNDSAGNLNQTDEWSVTLTADDATTPTVSLISPLNDSGDSDGNITFVFNVSDAGGVDNCSLVFNGVVNQTNTTITKNVNTNFNVSNLIVGSYNWSVNCSDDGNNIGASEVRVFAVVVSNEFLGESTDLSTVNMSNISYFVLANPEYGKINFSESVDLSNGSEVDSFVNISFNRIELNSTGVSELNKSARLNLYNLTFSDPRVLKDGVVCSSSDCVEVSYSGASSGGTFVFDVTGFSVYSSDETPVSEDRGGGSSGGGSSIAAAPGRRNITGTEGRIEFEPREIKIKSIINEVVHRQIKIQNLKPYGLSLNVDVIGLKRIFDTDEEITFRLPSGETKIFDFRVLMPTKPGTYTGKIFILGNEIPVVLDVLSSNATLFDVLIDIDKEFRVLREGQELKTNITLIPVTDDLRFDVTANYLIKDFKGNVVFTKSETFLIEDKINFTKEFATNELEPGDYVLSLELVYPDGVAVSSVQFRVKDVEKPREVRWYEKVKMFLKWWWSFVKEKAFWINGEAKEFRGYVFERVRLIILKTP